MTKGKRSALWAAIIMLAAAVALPSVALAQGRGNGRGKNKASQQQKKNEKFKNGHDARDGRWDGRGPGSRDDDYDDDDDYNGRNRRRSDRDNDGYYDRSEVRRVAADRGYSDGYRAGQDDRASGRGSDYDDHGAYRDATSGYRNEYGNIDYYRSSYREGFRQGYQDGYRNRTSRSGRWGNILGDILGRP